MEYALLGSTGVKVSRIRWARPRSGWRRASGTPTEWSMRHSTSASTSSTLPTCTGFCRSLTGLGAPPASEREPAERILGWALAGRRDDVVIATKSNEVVGPGVNDRGLSRRHIVQQVENSLRRLETDYIDLYYAHKPDPDTPLEQTLSACDDLVRQGKLRYVALSNHPAWQVTHALWIADDRRQSPRSAPR